MISTASIKQTYSCYPNMIFKLNHSLKEMNHNPIDGNLHLESNLIRNCVVVFVQLFCHKYHFQSTMQSFSSLLQKRKAGDANEYQSPKKKTANDNINVIMKKLNPYTLGVYFENSAGSTPYYWSLFKALDNEENWVKRLKISMSVRRRADAGSTTTIMKHTKKSYLDWHIFVRFLDEKELKKIDNIGEAWGKDITAAMNIF